MATYASLSAADKEVVQNAANLLRASIGALGKGWNVIKAIADDTNAVNLITSIDAADIIPNTSGLAGADDLTRTELVAMYTLMNSIRTINDTPANRAAMSKVAGINALMN